MITSVFHPVALSPMGVGDVETRRHHIRSSRLSYWLSIVSLTALMAASAALTYYYWPLKLAAPKTSALTTVTMASDGCLVSVPGRQLIADLRQFDDRFSAHLMFDYYRSRAAFRHFKLLLIPQHSGRAITYRLAVALPNDLLGAINTLAVWHRQGLTPRLNYSWYIPAVVAQYAAETSALVQPFRIPSQAPLRSMDPVALQTHLAKFIRFKSLTDPRVRVRSESAPAPLTPEAASRLASDMIAVANFYDIPLGLMVGIGAMENNFMSVPGDRANTKWKRHPEPGDVVLRRTRHRVLVKNDSSGVWQITRQSLRHAHRLYQKDNRDYSSLPAHLRPPKKFQMGTVSNDVLTTYAGLLLSDLLQQFHGDSNLAAGAYNGTVRHPNLHYAAGVDLVASYARTVISRSASLASTEVASLPALSS